MQVTRKKIAMLMAELLGTAVWTLALLGASRSIGYTYFIAIAVGLAVTGATLAFGTVSGAHLNPAVTIGLWSLRKIKLLPAIAYVAMQLAGGLVAYLLVTYLLNNNNINNPAHFDARILMAEAAGAFVFALGWAATVYQRMEGGKAAATIGIALALGVIVASLGSHGLLNPAVALGTELWVWGTYVLGPILGAIIGFNLYGLLFAPADAVVEAPAKKKR